jgi:hypothetical protein
VEGAKITHKFFDECFSAGESNNEEVASLKRRIQDLERDLVELRARQQGRVCECECLFFLSEFLHR